MTPAGSKIKVLAELKLRHAPSFPASSAFSTQDSFPLGSPLRMIPSPTGSVLYPLTLVLLIMKPFGALVENQDSSFSLFCLYSPLEKNKSLGLRLNTFISCHVPQDEDHCQESD